jgi:ATP-binding cassette subfamily B protein
LSRSSSVSSLQLVSSTRGRARFRLPRLQEKESLAERVTAALASQRGVQSVVVTAVTGSVLVRFDGALSVAVVSSWVRAALEQAEHGLRIGSAAPSAAAAPTESALLGLARRFSKRRGLFASTLAVSVGDRMFEAAPPLMIAAGVDIVTRGNQSILARFGLRSVSAQFGALALVGAFVWTLDSLSNYVHSVTAGKLAQTVKSDLRRELYEHLQSLDLAYVEGRPVSEWMTLLDRDIERLQSFIEDGLDPLVTIGINLLLVGGTFWSVSPPLALVQAATIPALFWVSTKLLGPIRRRHAAARDAETELSTLLATNISGLQTIAAFSAQAREAGRVTNADAHAVAKSERAGRLMAAYVPTIQMVVGVGFLTTLTWGGVLSARGRIQPAAYNMLGFQCLRLLSSLGRLGVSLEKFQRAMVSVERINRVLAQRPTVVDGPRRLPRAELGGDVIFENVVFGYSGDQPVLRNIDLHFARGKTTAIVGVTGAGKSTVLKVLLRFYDVTSGSVRIDETDIRQVAVDDLRRSIGFVSQEVFLFKGTIRENIAYAKPEASSEAVVQAALIADAHGFIEALPAKYETMLGERGRPLSGGQRQRIAIARAVLADRPILVFDEATSAIDTETEGAIQRSLRSFSENRTTILVAHRLSTVRHADRIYVLDGGRVRESGKHDELVALGGAYASFWRIQTGEPSDLQP